jgi:hypothetical protein
MYGIWKTGYSKSRTDGSQQIKNKTKKKRRKYQKSEIIKQSAEREKEAKAKQSI